jgi:hypothetical protein
LVTASLREEGVPALEFRCRVGLSNGVVISVPRSADPKYQPASWTLPNGEVATVVLDVPREEVEAFLSGRRCPDGFAVCMLPGFLVTLSTNNVSDEDLARLHCRHPTARKFVGDGKTRQEAEKLGVRVATAVRDAANTIIEELRARQGQFWLERVDFGAVPGNFLLAGDAEWRESDGQWQQFFPIVRTDHRTLVIPRRKLYLELHDWERACEAVRSRSRPAVALTILANARERFRLGDKMMAIMELGLALESGAMHFVETRIGDKLPPRSLKRLLRSNLDELLHHWVRPLEEQESGQRLTEEDWKAAHDIRRLRGRAAHPRNEGEVVSEVDKRFGDLVQSAARVIGRLVGEEPPKTPPYWPGGLGGSG